MLRVMHLYIQQGSNTESSDHPGAQQLTLDIMCSVPQAAVI